jgi:hypothetical protein
MSLYFSSEALHLLHTWMLACACMRVRRCQLKGTSKGTVELGDGTEKTRKTWRTQPEGIFELSMAAIVSALDAPGHERGKGSRHRGDEQSR